MTGETFDAKGLKTLHILEFSRSARQNRPSTLETIY